MGFRERKSSVVGDFACWEVLPRHVSDLLLPVRALIGSMATRDGLAQVRRAAPARPPGPPTSATVPAGASGVARKPMLPYQIV